MLGASQIFEEMIMQSWKFFNQKFLMKILGANLFSRKWICNHKNFETKFFFWKFWVHTCFRGNDFATIKILWPNFFLKILGGNLFSRKWFCNHKIFSTEKLFKTLMGANLFSKKWFCNHNNFSINSFWWKFWVQKCFRGKYLASLIILY